MAGAAVAAQLRHTLTGDVQEDMFAVAVQAAIADIGKLTARERVELVLSTAWGELIFARISSNEAFRLLRVLCDAKPPLPVRQRFYESFDCQGLCEACVEQLRNSTSENYAIDIRHCVRNLARYPVFRLRLSAALPILADSMKDDGRDSRANLDVVAASAAALCNICCDNAVKAEAVRLGVVPSLLLNLKKSPSYAAAEDLVACVGVCTAGFTPGIEALFNSGEGAVLVACLCGDHPSALQALAAEVLLDLCGCSKSFTAWLVTNTDLLQAHLGRLLSLNGDPELLAVALKLCARLSEHREFAKKIQEGDAVNALQAIARMPGEASVEDDSDDERRPPTKQAEAMAILGKVLFF